MEGMTTHHLDCSAAAADAGLTALRLEELSQVARASADLGGSVLMQHYGQLESILDVTVSPSAPLPTLQLTDSTFFVCRRTKVHSCSSVCDK